MAGSALFAPHLAFAQAEGGDAPAFRRLTAPAQIEDITEPAMPAPEVSVAPPELMPEEPADEIGAADMDAPEGLQEEGIQEMSQEEGVSSFSRFLTASEPAPLEPVSAPESVEKVEAQLRADLEEMRRLTQVDDAPEFAVPESALDEEPFIEDMELPEPSAQIPEVQHSESPLFEPQLTKIQAEAPAKPLAEEAAEFESSPEPAVQPLAQPEDMGAPEPRMLSQIAPQPEIAEDIKAAQERALETPASSSAPAPQPESFASREARLQAALDDAAQATRNAGLESDAPPVARVRDAAGDVAGHEERFFTSIFTASEEDFVDQDVEMARDALLGHSAAEAAPEAAEKDFTSFMRGGFVKNRRARRAENEPDTPLTRVTDAPVAEQAMAEIQKAQKEIDQLAAVSPQREAEMQNTIQRLSDHVRRLTQMVEPQDDAGAPDSAIEAQEPAPDNGYVARANAMNPPRSASGAALGRLTSPMGGQGVTVGLTPSQMRAREAEYQELIQSLIMKIKLLEQEKEQLRRLKKDDFIIPDHYKYEN